ncbi:MAG: outer membrane beta-barrel protein [Chitinivibrionales bacterium]|nr:outer membrane beta-barrel protein [Chitinivibrionales bacterium]
MNRVTGRGFFVLFFLHMMALHTFAMDCSIALKGGVGLGTLHGSFIDAVDAELKPAFDEKIFVGPYCNLCFGLHYSEYLTLQFECAYSFKGRAYESRSDDGEVRIQYSYVDLPFIVRLDIPLNASVHPMIYAGPQMSILTSSSVQSTVALSQNTVNFEKNTRNSDLAAVAGGGVHFRLSSCLWWFQDIRFLFGQTNILDNRTFPSLEIKTALMVCMAGLSIVF